MSLDRPIARPISTALARPMTGRAEEEGLLLWTAGTGPVQTDYDGTSLTWAESTTAPVTIRFE